MAPLPATRHWFGFFGRAWFWIAASTYGAGLAIAYAADTTENLSLVPLAGIGVLGVLTGFCLIAWQRLRVSEAIASPRVLLWGLVSGAVAYAISYLIEGRLSGAVESALTGPIEESSKLLVPVLLYFAMPKVFRDPRSGFALVLVGASAVGLAEGIQNLWPHMVETVTTYTGGGRPDSHSVAWSHDFEVLSMAVQRPFAELMHPILTGFVAAVAWFFAWHRGGRLFTWYAVGAWAVALGLHSLNDSVPTGWNSVLQIAIWLVVLVGSYYALYRRNARQLVPPSAVEVNPVGWRPHLGSSRALR